MNTIHFHIEAKNIPDLKRQLLEALGENEATVQPQLLNMCAKTAETQAVLDSMMAKTSGSTEPDRNEAPQEQDEQAAPGQEQSVKTYELTEVRAAANAYKDKHGIEKLREIFGKHGGEKLKDIPEKNYAALMKEIA